MSFNRRQSAPETISKYEIPGLRDYLSRSDLFCSCPTSVQDALLSHFHYRHFKAGELLIQSGNTASTMFILLKGNVQVISDKYEAVLAELGPGMIFGEISALFGVPRTASVISKSPGLVAVIDKESLKRAIGKHHKVLWNHIKGIAMSRYRSTLSPESRIKLNPSVSEKRETFLKSKVFQGIPEEVLEKISELTEVEELKAETIVDFFSPRAKHLLYLIKEGTVKANYLSDPPKTLNLHSGDIFKSYEVDLDFVKTLTDKTVLYQIDVQQAVAIFAEQEDLEIQKLGEILFETHHLNDQIDANSSITSNADKFQVNDLKSIMNPAQFSRRRRNSTPIFSDLGKENSFKFVGVRESIPQEVATMSSKSVNNDKDLKALLLNAGVVVPENITLLFEDRLSLTAVKNELTDSILLAIVSVIGSQIKVLNLSDCHLLTSSGILAIWLRCPRLVKVSLQGCWNLDDLAFSTLSRCECAETLRELNVSHCWRLSSKVLNLISDLNITKLDLSYCKSLDDRTWPALTQFSQSLRSLKLRRCLGVTDSSFEGLFGIQFVELEYLDLGECSFLTDSAISTILLSAPNLRNLNLSLITSLKGSFLLHHDSLHNLKVLNLSHLKEVVNESFCLRLAKVCPNLESLHLDGCSNVDDDCLAHLTNSNLVNLKVLTINDCPLVSNSTFDYVNLQYNPNF